MCMEVIENKNCASSWRKLWLAVMTAEGATDEEDFAGFYVRNKETFHEIVSTFVKMDPSNPKFAVSHVDVEQWINANKGIAESGTIADGDVTML